MYRYIYDLIILESFFFLTFLTVKKKKTLKKPHINPLLRKKKLKVRNKCFNEIKYDKYLKYIFKIYYCRQLTDYPTLMGPSKTLVYRLYISIIYILFPITYRTFRTT